MSENNHPDAFTCIDDLLPSFYRSKRRENVSERTLKNYLYSAKSLSKWLTENDRSNCVAFVSEEDIEDFTISYLRRGLESSAATHHRNLKQYCKWLAEKKHISVNPMADMKEPSVKNKKLQTVLTQEELRSLLAVCFSTSFVDRRDLAIILLLIDTGLRRSELISMRTDNLSLIDGRALVTAKGGAFRLVPFGQTTAAAIDEYLSARRKSKFANEKILWLGQRGPLSGSGLAQMLERRGEQSGVAEVNPHRFRHTFSHNWLLEGGNESDLMHITGWSTRQMIGHYAKSCLLYTSPSPRD